MLINILNIFGIVIVLLLGTFIILCILKSMYKNLKKK